MNQPHILIIDDEPGIREGCRRALALQGFSVQTAENGDEGLQIIETDGIDLALIDVMMPGIGGLELIARIHQHDPEIVCIIITGYATVELAVAALKQGAYDFLTKPFTTDDLTLVVNQGVERRQLTLETKRLQSIEAEAQRLAEEKARLEELDRAKVAFIRLVTHELQAPISAISTYLDLMLNDYIPAERQREYLEKAQERAKEQIDLIADLLEFGRLKEIKTAGKPAPLQIETVLSQVLEGSQAQATEKGIQITADISPGLPPVCMPPEQAKSIWMNLISNAIKYTSSGGQVTVRLRQQDGNLLGEVQDTGIGIPEEARDSLFTEFFRARNAKALGIPGTGLGLAIIKQIIEKAGGNISVESQAGQGSTFSFRLPAAIP